MLRERFFKNSITDAYDDVGADLAWDDSLQDDDVLLACLLYTSDIQASPDFFSLSLEDTARLCAQYPQLAGHTTSVLAVPRYLHDEGQDTSSKSVVVDWYYKRPDETGRMVLHYCKFCNGVVLYACLLYTSRCV